jgi:PKHD-type hydroxylase
MNLENYYWYFNEGLSKNLCNDIIQYALSKQKEEGIVDGVKRSQDSLDISKKIDDMKKEIRNSHVVWLDEKWIYNELQPFVREANEKAGWNFEWSWSESCQFTIYTKNQFYDWHTDSSSGVIKEEGPLNNLTRKISMSVLLNDPTEYCGGELEFDFKNIPHPKNAIRQATEINKQGSIVVFPSFVWHRVKPVTQGTRYSLVMWNNGKPFR